MTKNEIMSKIKKCSELTHELYKEGIIRVSPYDMTVQCTSGAFIKLAETSEVDPYWSNEFQKITAEEDGFELFKLGSESEMQIIQVEIKKATEVAE